MYSVDVKSDYRILSHTPVTLNCQGDREKKGSRLAPTETATIKIHHKHFKCSQQFNNITSHFPLRHCITFQ